MASSRRSSRPAHEQALTAMLLKCIDVVSDALLITEAAPLDAPGPRIVFANAAFERMTGYGRSDIVGKTPRVLQGPKTDRAELRRIRLALTDRLPVRAELVNYKQSGEEFFVEMDIVPVSDASGRWTHSVSIQRDATQRRKVQAEAHAHEARHFDLLGTMSSDVAHDFNNIIAAILGNVAIGAADMRAGQMPHASLEQIEIAALRARSAVAKILAYGQRRPETARDLQLAPVVREATDLLRASLPADVRLEVGYPAEPLWIRGDASQLSQVLLNLGVHAVQALKGEAGRIDFRLEGLGEPSSGGASSARPCASIQVSHDGDGMDAETQARIFEPPAATEGVGSGTGLGLSGVWSIIEAHGGTIALDSGVGQGSRIQVSLPLIVEQAGSAATLSDPAAADDIGRGEHVLVVDDDEVVVVMLEAMLTRWGFRVTSLRDPLQAVSRVKRSPNEFDAVVTDLNMPHISGLQLAVELLAVRRDMPVLLTSGNVSEELVAAASSAGVVAVFLKEYAVERLGRLLKEALKHT